MGQVIQLQGDQRTKIAEILMEEGISTLESPARAHSRPPRRSRHMLTISTRAEKDVIKVHGF
jgi:hypothetical protein